MLAALLPQQLEIAAPFPHVISDAPTLVRIAPGVDYAGYQLSTDAGPIAVRALAVAPRTPNLRLGSVLADGELTSTGETLSSMARRTGAIAGINADYFDIDGTNQPTNIVVHEGVLVRSPRKRYALVITSDGTPQILENAFAGSVTIGAHSVSLEKVNVMPPPGDGASLLTPTFGPVPPDANATLIALEPAQGMPPPLCTYRVTSIADGAVRNPPGYYLALGENADLGAALPEPGDVVTANGDLSPIPLANVAAAVGGGPLLLDRGSYVDDPDGPNGPDFEKRSARSGAAIAADGTLFFVEVDGREAQHSVGVTRPELAALMRALGGVRALAFDGGGSSELVARMPAETEATPQGDPSDGHERKIADGIFVYDDAPAEAASQIVASPQAVHAMSGARVVLRAAYADANGRVATLDDAIAFRVEPASLGRVVDGEFIAASPGNGTILLSGGSFTDAIPVEVAADPARIEIAPAEPSAPANGTIHLSARAFDAAGYRLALDPDLPWRALNGSIDPRGNLIVGSRDAIVSLLLGDHLANASVAVGFHDVALDVQTPHVMTIPAGGDAQVILNDPACPQCLQLRYALGPHERAAYLVAESAMPMHSVGIAFDVLDDGMGAILKLALRNAIDEEVLLPAGRLDKPGWRSVFVRLPAALAQPARLMALYVIAPRSGQAIAGSISVRNLRAVAAGTRSTRP